MLENTNNMMSRVDAYRKFLETKNVELQMQYSNNKKLVLSFKLLTSKIRIPYYDYKNWYGCVLDKYIKTPDERKILKHLGSDIEIVKDSYDEKTKTIDVRGVIEIISLDGEYLNETINYQDVIIDLFSTLYHGQMIKGYDMSVDRPLTRPYVFHAIFMLNINKSDLEYYKDKVENRRTCNYFREYSEVKENKYSYDAIKSVFGIVYMKKIPKGSEFYLLEEN